jgi:two-component system sensor histidine kinase DesK
MTGVSVPAGEGDQFNDVPDRPNPISLFPWLLVAVGAAVDTVNGKFRPSWLAGAGLVLFAVLYLAVLRLGVGKSRSRTVFVLLGALGAVAAARRRR